MGKHTATEEQIKILESLEKGNNVKVSAIAGSGKTSTSIFIANKFKDKKCMLLTYNKTLSEENNSKIKSAKIDNLECKTFHSFFAYSYDVDCSTDFGLKSILNDNLDVKKISEIDLFIFDEVQDMTPLIYECLIKTYFSNYKNCQIIILGDEFQTLYQFKKSSSYFLSEYEKVWKLNDKKWDSLRLTESFRVTSDTANFINKVLYENHDNKPVFNSKKTGEKNNVTNLIVDVFNPHSLFNLIEDELNKYKNNEIFILAPSVTVKTNHPVKLFANYLSEKGRLVNVTDKQNENLNRDILKNKICVTSFHRAKGREKKLVIIFGFDDSFNLYYNNKILWNSPDNRLYVGVTRAKERTFLLTHYGNAPLRTINWENNEKLGFVKFANKDIENKFDPKKSIDKEIENAKLAFYVTDILNFVDIDNHDVERSFESSIELIKNPHKFLTSSTLSFIHPGSNEEYFEDISAINGTVFPLEYFHSLPSNDVKDNVKIMCDIFYDHNMNLNDNDANTTTRTSKKVTNFIEELLTLDFTLPEHFVKYAIGSQIVYSGNESIVYQLKKHNFINQSDVLASNNIFNSLYSTNIEFEKHVEGIINEIIISGAIDVIDHTNKIIWENKFVNKVTDHNVFQLIFYKYLLDLKEPGKYKDYTLKLLNLKKGEIFKVELLDGYEKVIVELVQRKILLNENIIESEKEKEKIIKLANELIYKYRIS